MGVSIVKNSGGVVIGVGSALMDILIKESDSFVEKTGAPKGGMTLVDSDASSRLLSSTNVEKKQVPGGSTCNTIIGIAKLGAKTRFIGKRGNDTVGEDLEKALIANNVEPVLEKSSTPTGKVVSVITPDAQRTMYTFLGAASESAASEMVVEKFKGSSIVHLEGYLLFNRDLIFAALDAAKAAGAIISLDLASFTVVEVSKDILATIIKDYVDILIANEDEAFAYTGIADEELSLKKLSENVKIAVLKVGKRGSYISYNNKISKIGIIGDGTALDTTGAGDLWAAGFLYGVLNGYSVEKCGEIGSACGYEVCQVIGAQIPEAGWDRISKVK